MQGEVGLCLETGPALRQARRKAKREEKAKKKALEQGFDWPPPSQAAIAEAKKQLQAESAGGSGVV